MKIVPYNSNFGTVLIIEVQENIQPLHYYAYNPTTRKLPIKQGQRNYYASLPFDLYIAQIKFTGQRTYNNWKSHLRLVDHLGLHLLRRLRGTLLKHRLADIGCNRCNLKK